MNRFKYTLFLFFLLSGLSFLIDQAGVFRSIEHTFLDNQFIKYQRDYPYKDISMVMIDQQSMRVMGNELRLYYPWPREIYGLVNDYLYEKGAKKIVYDVLFDQPDFNRDGINGSDSDLELSDAFYRSNNVTIAGQKTKLELTPPEGFFNINKKPFPAQQKLFSSLPIPELFDASKSIGNAAVPISFDGVIRYTQLLSFQDSLAIPALSLAALLSDHPRTNIPAQFKNNKLEISGLDSISVPYQKSDLYLINWYKKGGAIDGTFPQYSFVALLREAVKWQSTGEITTNDRLNIEGHTIFIGASAPGLADIKATPFSSIEPFPGVEIQATVYANLLHQDFLQPVSAFQKWALLLFGIFLICVSIFYSLPKISIPLSIAWVVGLIVTGLYLFSEFRIWLPTAEITIINLLSLTVTFTTRYVTEESNKKWLKQAFSRYVPKELVNQVIENPESLKLGGDKKELTVLFSDLAGFTTISEGMPPEELVPYLNEYLTEMTDLVFKHRGTLDKYIGDAIMAFWGAPLEDPKHAYNACACVIEMQELMVRLQEKWKITGKPITSTRYGVNTGNMVVGNVGSAERFNYTVLGDSVNLAARLEPANKNFGTNVMISEFTYKYIKDDFICRELDRLIVKGKSTHVKVYELMAKKGDKIATSELNTALNLYVSGLQFYYKRNWADAKKSLQEVLEIIPNDGPSITYIKRIEAFELTPPPEEWNGVFELKTK